MPGKIPGSYELSRVPILTRHTTGMLTHGRTLHQRSSHMMNATHTPHWKDDAHDGTPPHSPPQLRAQVMEIRRPRMTDEVLWGVDVLLRCNGSEPVLALRSQRQYEVLRHELS